MKDNKIVATLIAGMVGLALLWVTFAPEAVTQAEMQNYVKVTAIEHLKLLRSDLRDQRKVLSEVCQRLAGIEAVLRERIHGQ